MHKGCLGEIPEEWKYNPPNRPRDIQYNLPSYQQLYHHVPAKTQASLGALDVLSLELLQGMLAGLDFRSLTNFQAVNRQAYTVVNSVPAFKAIIAHARPALRSIIAVHADHLVTCQDFYNSMIFPECATCGDYGEYIYVLTCKRVCHLCLSSLEEYLPRSMQSTIRKFGLDHEILKTLPCLESMLGTYHARPVRRQLRRLILYDSSAARSAGVTLHGSEDAMSRHVLDAETRQMAEYRRKIEHFSNVDTRRNGWIDMLWKPQRPFEEVDQHEHNPLRWMGIVQVPSIQPPSREVEWGFRCAGCRGSSNHSTHWSKRYTPNTFRDHIKRFGSLINVAPDNRRVFMKHKSLS